VSGDFQTEYQPAEGGVASTSAADGGHSVERAWDAIRDFGAVHERLVPGFVVDCRLDGDARIVTFFSAMFNAGLGESGP
jgi:hypothetical protein